MSKHPLIFLPGMMCDARLFAPQIAYFSPDHEVAVLPIDAADTITGLASAVLRAAPDRFALAGLSMGGIVAMEVLRLAPERIDRLALLDTNPLAEKPHHAARRDAQIQAVRDGRLADVMKNEMKPNYLADTENRSVILDLCMDMALSLGPTAFVRQSRALQSRPDQSQTLRAARMPCLILCGRHDALCPVARHELMADLVAGSVLTIVEHAGHLPSLENPDATNTALESWLKS